MDNITASLNRIEGQVRGIKKMYESDRDCTTIAQQIVAIQQALKRVAKELLQSEACKCSGSPEQQDKLKSIVESLIKLN